jgi:hypothetical protein
MVSLLTLSIFLCIYLYTKHRQSLEQIKQMMVEFDKLTTADNDIDNVNFSLAKTKNDSQQTNMDLQLNNNLQNNNQPQALHHSTSSLSIFSKRRLSSSTNNDVNGELFLAKQRLLNEARQQQQQQQSEIDKSIDQIDNGQLKIAEQEIEKLKNELKNLKLKLDNTKYHPPSQLLHLLTRTYESEKELLEYKFKIIDKEKDACLDALNKVSKRQSGILGALKIAHSSTLEEVNHKLEILKYIYFNILKMINYLI